VVAVPAPELSVRRTPEVYLNMRNPYLLKYYYKFKTINLIDKDEISGSSPPDIFVGRAGYPNVYVGPLVPPQIGDTSMFATPEQWVGKSIPEIVEFRSMLVRGMYRSNVKNANGSKAQGMLQELAIADKYASVDMALERRPSLNISFSENSQPFGPSAPLKSMSVGNTTANRQLEKAFSDTDMGAKDAILELYEKNVQVSKIQKALSAGTLGVGNRRRFVPTRWSITAVDDTISKENLVRVKDYKTLDSVRVYETIALDNRWIILMLPGEWSYELIEAWYPNTTWNRESPDIAIYSSAEFFEGRKTYAEIGGCYYAARLAVSELLDRVGAQAKVVIMRETHSGYIMPVGVWNVREYVREALRKEPLYFGDMQAALAHISKRLDIPVATWIKNSTLLQNVLYQKRLAVSTA